ncbi:MAG: DUF3088 domain-containing protein [Candidatus Schekmanbacteria bacterium]|nr:MAG: DUF3088 domain-containing protein [Candidatus Schekmanbacteria bacterium]
MARPILFLLKPGFFDGSEGPFFCPDCAMVEGFLAYMPQIGDEVEIRRIDFKKPRKEIVELLGEENQGCPVLILTNDADNVSDEIKRSQTTGRSFIAGALEICRFLGKKFRFAIPHS